MRPLLLAFILLAYATPAFSAATYYCEADQMAMIGYGFDGPRWTAKGGPSESGEPNAVFKVDDSGQWSIHFFRGKLLATSSSAHRCAWDEIWKTVIRCDGGIDNWYFNPLSLRYQQIFTGQYVAYNKLLKASEKELLMPALIIGECTKM